jgi:hypothetical protein
MMIEQTARASTEGVPFSFAATDGRKRAAADQTFSMPSAAMPAFAICAS